MTELGNRSKPCQYSHCDDPFPYLESSILGAHTHDDSSSSGRNARSREGLAFWREVFKSVVYGGVVFWITFWIIFLTIHFARIGK
jgi:hypothetical protein